jgi:uncharacterized protein YgbK (DUF1537 family)
MIVVIADDLSGAAELAGIAAAHGLRAEVHTRFQPGCRADVIAMDTDTRSKPAGEAARIVEAVTRAACAPGPEWLYKKTDSVLRGNIGSEVGAMLRVMGKQQAMLVPANPSRGRIIRGGKYLVNGQPLHETAFGRDPDHPRRTDDVRELLNWSTDIHTPDVTSADEVRQLAANLAPEVFPAGGADFFEALLRLRRGDWKADCTSAVTLALPALFVCGSGAAWMAGRGAEARAKGIPILPMPEALFRETASGTIDVWVRAAVDALRSRGAAMMSIGSETMHPSPSQLLVPLVAAVGEVMAQVSVGGLYVEGGATAAELVRCMKWRRLAALPVALHGVGVLSPLDTAERCPVLCLKPGSYPWPSQLWPSWPPA